jgi:hypothetical protein
MASYQTLPFSPRPPGNHHRTRIYAGFVFFGHRLHGLANAIIGPLFGCLLAAYAYGVWTMRWWVVPIALAYAAYVPMNLVLFAMGPPPGSGGSVFDAIYTLIAIGVSGGGAWYVYTHRDQLR